MKIAQWLPGLILGAGMAGAAFSQSQKIPITGCTTNYAPVAGYDCTKAYDGNPATNWRIPGDAVTHVLDVNFSAARRVKRLVVTWDAVPNGDRHYFATDREGVSHWLGYRIGGTTGTTDDIVLKWGSNNYDPDTVLQARTISVYTYSSTVAGLREIDVYGPGLYSENQIITRRIPIPAWNMVAELSKTIPVSPAIPANRVVGASAFLYSDYNVVQNFTSLSVHPIGAYQYSGGTGDQPAGFYLTATGPAGSTQIESIEMTGNRTAHQNSNFDDPNKNPRGWITIQYLSQSPEFP